MALINFASDNHSGVHPRVLEWLKDVNHGPMPSYGRDEVTERALVEMKKQFGLATESFFVWNGTAANVLGLSAATRPYQSIICSDMAHIAQDECGAPEKHLGSKLLLVPTPDGKITVDQLIPYFERRGDVQATQPKVISLTQATEYGTIYSVNELKALIEFAHAQNAYVHVDGARLANAAVSLDLGLNEMTTDLGVDIISFGGTKNGLMGAEAVVFKDENLATDFQFIRKQGLHLASKMRYLSAQFLAYFEDDLWRKNALHANRMATLLAQKLSQKGAGIHVNNRVQANGVFVSLPRDAITRLQKNFRFYVWNEAKLEVRLMCSFDTTENEVEAFVNAL